MRLLQIDILTMNQLSRFANTARLFQVCSLLLQYARICSYTPLSISTRSAGTVCLDFRRIRGGYPTAQSAGARAQDVSGCYFVLGLLSSTLPHLLLSPPTLPRATFCRQTSRQCAAGAERNLKARLFQLIIVANKLLDDCHKFETCS